MALPDGRLFVAFDDDPYEPDPTWTRLDLHDGLRVQSWQVDRGRPSEFDKTGTGTATVKILDLAGLLDPTNPSSPYAGKLGPRKQAALRLRNPVLDEWQTVFRGFVEDWDYVLASPTRGWMEVELQLVDAFALFATEELQPGVDGDDGSADGAGPEVVFYNDADKPRTRIRAVLDDVGPSGWPSDLTDILPGNVSVKKARYSQGTAALEVMFDAADAEFPGVANLYVSREGIVTFHGRQPRFRPDVAEYGINERTVGDDSAWKVDPEVVPVSELGFGFGRGIVNQCSATPRRDSLTDVEVAAQLVTDATSIANNGRCGLQFDNLLTDSGLATGNTDLEETKLFATYYVDAYKDPAPRVSRMVFKSKEPQHSNAGALWRHITRAEISDLLNLTTEHPGGGGFGESFYVEALHYEGRPLGTDDYDYVELSCDVSPASLYGTNPFDADENPGEL